MRRGNYRDGTFRFTMVLPDGYSGINTHPQITFVPPIFNPLVDPETGKLDISVDPAMRTWQPDKHFILNALTFLKSIFYLKSFDLFTPVADNTALALFNNDSEEFKRRAAECVSSSLSRLMDPPPPQCPVVFTESKPAHEKIKQNVLAAYEESDEGKKARAAEEARRAADEAAASAEADDSDEDYDLGTHEEEESPTQVLEVPPPAPTSEAESSPGSHT